ncbi:MAG: Binding-protein-dependent transport systems inner membrane component [Acetothermia bacterium 64_32]|nr:MAG: Binding-protein-dependent transport systems inner membrane component [Acetothermia bacterium 64_32]HAF70643.1 peptide ABC transporter permease [Candidatus Acetothermia bacterium]
MWAYFLRRLGYTLVTLWGLTLITFVLTRVVPGDPARTAAGPQARQEQVEEVRKLYGLDKPLWVQYGVYMRNLLRGDFGKSLWSKQPVVTDIKAYFLPTLELGVFAGVLFFTLGVPLGVLSAVYRNSLLDHGSRLLSLAGVSLPVFILGLLLQLVFYKLLGWFPAGGRFDPFVSPPQHLTGLYILDSLLTGNWKALACSLHHIFLPAVTLAYGSLAVVSRMTRASLLEVFGQDYIKTARAKGLSERAVLLKHALRNAMVPILTITGLQVGSLLGGVLLVEVIFSWPGLGTYAYTAVTVLDVNAIMAITLITGIIYTGVNFLVDFLYTVVDPRIRYQ